jgi:hypothetical protein
MDDDDDDGNGFLPLLGAVVAMSVIVRTIGFWCFSRGS